MVHASKSKKIFFLNKKSITPIPNGPNPKLWLNSNSGDLTWSYIDSDLQESIVIEVSESKSTDNLISSKQFDTNLEYLPISEVDIPPQGLYYWRIKAKGTQASEFSDFSGWMPIKIDSEVPILSDIDIVSVYNGLEFHSNMKTPFSKLGEVDGIFVSADQSSRTLNLDFSYPFDDLLFDTVNDLQNRASSRTYFVDIYFPDKATGIDTSSITGDLDYFHYALGRDPSLQTYIDFYGFNLNSNTASDSKNQELLDFFVRQAALPSFNYSVSKLIEEGYSGLSFSKVSLTLFVPKTDAEGRDREKWKFSIPYSGVVLIKSFYFNSDVVNKAYANVYTGLKREKTWDQMALDNRLFLFSPENANAPTGIRDTSRLLRIGKNYTFPETYVTTPTWTNGSAVVTSVNRPFSSGWTLLGLPRFSMGIGLNSTRDLELIKNSYYFENADARNSVKSLGGATNEISTGLYDLNSFRVGDKVKFLNSYYVFKNYPTKAVIEQNTTRAFPNEFIINDIDDSSNTITLDDDYDNTYTNERYPDGSDLEYFEIPISSLQVTTDTHGNTITILTDDNNNILFSQLTDNAGELANETSDIPLEGEITSSQTGDRSLSNRFVGIKMNSDSDSSFLEYPILNNIGNSITILGDVTDNLSYSNNSEEISYYVSGDTFSIYNPSLSIENNSVTIHVKTQNNISGVKGIKVIEKFPTDNSYSYTTDISPTVLESLKVIQSNNGIIYGPEIFEYNISAVKADGVETIFSNNKKVTITSIENRYITLSWANVTDAVGYYVYGRSQDENRRTAIAYVPSGHSSPEGASNSISWNDYGEIEQGTISTTASVGIPSNATTSALSNFGELKKNTTYYYRIVSFSRSNLNVIRETDYLSVSHTESTLDNFRLQISWTGSSNASGYRVYKQNDDGEFVLINTLFGYNSTSIIDSGPISLQKSMSSNRYYTRDEPTPSEVTSSSNPYYDVYSSNVNLSPLQFSEDGEDVGTVKYRIRNSTEEIVDLFFAVLSNSNLESSSDSEDLGTASISRNAEQTGIFYDYNAPSGVPTLISNVINSSEENVVIDYNSIISDSKDIIGSQFSNFPYTFYTPPELSYTGVKSWKVGFEVRYVVGLSDTNGNNIEGVEEEDFYNNDVNAYPFEENKQYGVGTHQGTRFYWAKIPIRLETSIGDSPISISTLSEPFVSDIVGKTVFIGDVTETNDSMTCLGIERTGSYLTMRVKLRTLTSNVIDYLKGVLEFNKVLTINIVNLASGSFATGGLRTEFQEIDTTNGSYKPFAFTDFGRIDFAESSDTPAIEQKKLGQSSRSQTPISTYTKNNLSVGEDTNVEFVLGIFSGHFYAPMTGNYVFDGTVAGNQLLKIDNIELFNNFGTVNPNRRNNLVTQTSEVFRLKRGWHQINFSSQYVAYLRNADAGDLNRTAIMLENECRIDPNHFPKYPIINEVDEVENTMTFTSSTGSKTVENSSLVGQFCMFELADPATGDSIPSSSEIGAVRSREDLEGSFFNNQVKFDAQEEVLGNTYTHIRGVVQNASGLSLSPTTTIDGEDYIQHYHIIQPNIKENEFALVTKTGLTTESKRAIWMLNDEDRYPIFSWINDSTSDNNKYRICKWILKIADNIDDVIYFEDPIEGTWTDYEELSNGTTKLYSDEIGFNHDELDFFGFPVKLDTEDTVTGEVRQALFIPEAKAVIIAGKLNDFNGSYSIDDLIGRPFSIGNVSTIASQDDVFYVNYGRRKNAIEQEFLTKNATTVYGNYFDKYQNQRALPLTISLTGLVPTANLANAVVEYFVSGPKNNQYTFTNVGEQVYDAHIIDRATGIYESDIMSGGAGFEFWREITWNADLNDAEDVKIEVRTAETEEELLNKTYNQDAFGITYPAYTVLDWDTPANAVATGVNILHYTSDGTLNDNNELVKNKFLQFRVTLSTSSQDYSPTLNSVTVKYSTGNSVLLLSKNIELDSNLIRGIITANTDIPDGTRIIWGISTDNDDDFNNFQRIYLDEAFEIPENNRASQFKIGAQLVSSNEDIPKIFDIGFMFESESGEHLLNL